jgi:membrane protein YqaA with SNARE-associated domain
MDKNDRKLLASWRTYVLQAGTTAGDLARSRLGLPVLAAISLAESALPVPLLTDPFLLGYILADRSKTIAAFIITTISSVLGGVLAFFTASYVLQVLVSWLSPTMVAELAELQSSATDGEFLLTLTGAVTPIPYTLTAWAVAGVEGSLVIFIIASLIGRGFRYGVVAWCGYRFGTAAMQYARKYLLLASIAVLVVVVAYVLYKM